VNGLLDPSYFDVDELQPSSSGSSDMPNSMHSSTGTVPSEIEASQTDLPSQKYGLLANDLMREEPLDFSSWAGMGFQPSGSAIPIAPESGFFGHQATMSTSESERTHSTEESSVSTPVLDALGLSHIGDGMDGDIAPAQPNAEAAMDIRW
jgi:hypothetical protein